MTSRIFGRIRMASASSLPVSPCKMTHVSRGKLLHAMPLGKSIFTSASAEVPLPKPLEGVKVLEMGQLIAGPFTSTLLGYYGADVIKIEPPQGGDPIRRWRGVDEDGTAPWFRSLGRNKRSCCINLRDPEGQKLAKELAIKSDVIVENFRPGTMEKWGMGPDELYKHNPSLVYTRVSGYGQTGPYASKPGYASVCEAMGGLRHLTGFPGGPPVRSNISLGDSLAGLHAAFGTVLALLARHRIQSRGEGQAGQVVDVAIYESVFNMLEGVIPDYDRFGMVRQPSGTTVTGIVPTNAYPCQGGRWVVIGGNGDSIYVRLMKAAGRPDLTGPGYMENADRIAHQEEIDAAIGAWTGEMTVEEVLARLEEAGVPGGSIYDAKDILEDPQYRARGQIEEVSVHGRSLKIPAISPRLTRTPGETLWAGPELGEHTDEVLEEFLHLGGERLGELRAAGVIGAASG